MVVIISSSAWAASTRSAMPRWTVSGAPMI